MSVKALFVLLLAVGVLGSSDQGINEQPNSQEIAESVKQEVYLKTRGEPDFIIGAVKTKAEFDRREKRGIGDGAKEDTGIGHGAVGSDSDSGFHVGGGARPRMTPGIGGGVESEPEAESGIGSGVQSEPEPVGGIGSGVQSFGRFRRYSAYKSFDSGYSKECNSYYGRVICYRVYTNLNIEPSPDYTCWRIAGNRRNCTEIDNVRFLRQRGFQSFDSEVQGPQPRGRDGQRRREKVMHGQDSYYDPYRPQQQQQQQSYHHDYQPQQQQQQSRYQQPRDRQSQHKFQTQSFNFDSDSLEEDTPLYRDKRSVHARPKGFYVPPDYEIVDEYMPLTRQMTKPRKPVPLA